MSGMILAAGALALAEHARGLAGAEEGIACAGTALERRTFHVRGKNFLFLGPAGEGWTAMLKVQGSLDEAVRLASERPGTYKVGAHGWVTFTASGSESAPEPLLRWLDESHAAAQPKRKVRV